MRLSECLNASDIDTLRTIAESYRLDCHRSSKNSLLQSILYHFKNRGFIRESIQNLQQSACREALLQLAIDKRQSFSYEELSAVAARAAVNDTHQAPKIVKQLQQDGWVYRLKSKGGRSTYYIPEDMLLLIREYVNAYLQRQVETVNQFPVIYRDDQFAVIRDTIQFITFVRNNDLQLTQDGVIFKRQLISLLGTFEIAEQPLVNPGWRFGYGRSFHSYPDRFALIYDYCLVRGLIEETDEDKLKVTQLAESWINKPDKDKLTDLFRFWRLLYRRAIPKLSLAVNTLARAIENQWTLVESVNRLLDPYVSEFYYDSQLQVLDARIYQMLVYLGFITRGTMGDSQHVIKLSELGKELLLQDELAGTTDLLPVDHPPLLIQPNFDLLLPASAPGKLSWQIGQFADLVRPDAMRVYRMSKNSISRALHNGWSVERILQFLDNHSGSTTPANIKRMLTVWGETLSV